MPVFESSVYAMTAIHCCAIFGIEIVVLNKVHTAFARLGIHNITSKTF